jgi:outer membrane lipoprotein LolB
MSQRMPSIIRLSILFVIVMLLSSCAQTMTKSTSSPDWQPIDVSRPFTLSGKMSFSDGSEGGSGQVTWEQRPEQLTVTLKAPLSKRSWELTEFQDHAALKHEDGSVYLASQTDELLDEQMGWDVPWQALKLWVTGRHTSQGRRSAEDADELVIDDQGWQITYSRFKDTDKGWQPSRVMARKEPFSIKLIIRQWDW